MSETERTQELTVRQHEPPREMPFADMERLAVAIAKSGMFGMKTPEQALTLMMISQAEGRHPALAARDYDIIQGRPAKKAEAMLRDFLDAGGKVEWHALNDMIADATFAHPQGGTARISWDMARAATAQLAGKDMYKKFPRQMLRSRTVSEGVRTVWPMASSGFYVPEEARDIPFSGTTIDHTPAPEQPAADTVASHGNGHAKPEEGTLDEPNGTKWLKILDVELANAQSQIAVATIAGHRSVTAALDTAPTTIKARINEMLTDAYARFAETEPRVNPEPEPADALIARIEAMDFITLRALDTNATYRAELNALPADAARAVVEAVSGRIANLRAGA